MLQPSRMITISRQLETLRREHPSLEDVITEAEDRFRDEELEHDWSSQPIEIGGISPLPSCWKPGIAYAVPVVVAYAEAQARKASDPVKFEQFTEDMVAAVAQETLLNKLSEYARVPGNFSAPVIEAFIADVRGQTKRRMKKLRQDVLKRRKGMPRPRVESATTVIEARPDKPASRRPAAKKKVPTRRTAHPNVMELVAGKEFISPEHAAEWFGTSPRNLRNLPAMGRIEIRG